MQGYLMAMILDLVISRRFTFKDHFGNWSVTNGRCELQATRL